MSVHRDTTLEHKLFVQRTQHRLRRWAALDFPKISEMRETQAKFCEGYLL